MLLCLVFVTIFFSETQLASHKETPYSKASLFVQSNLIEAFCVHFYYERLTFFSMGSNLLWKLLLTKAGWEIFQVLARIIAALAGLVLWLWISQKVPFFLPFTPNNAPPEICHKGLF